MHNRVEVTLHALFHIFLEKISDFSLRDKLTLYFLNVCSKMTQDMSFFFIILSVKSCNYVLGLMFTHFEVECFILKIPVIQNEDQVISDSDFIILGISFFENASHDGDQHVQEMDNHYEATEIENTVKVDCLSVFFTSEFELVYVVEV